MSPEVESLFSDAGDFDLCDGVFVKIGDERGHEIDVTQYTVQERTVVLVWHASGIIDNGGFEYLFGGDFPGDPGFQYTAAAFEAIGCERAVDAFNEAFALFPDSQLPSDVDERMDIYVRTPESRREEINTRFWEVGWDDEIEKKLAEYIRSNKEHFVHLR